MICVKCDCALILSTSNDWKFVMGGLFLNPAVRLFKGLAFWTLTAMSWRVFVQSFVFLFQFGLLFASLKAWTSWRSSSSCCLTEACFTTSREQGLKQPNTAITSRKSSPWPNASSPSSSPIPCAGYQFSSSRSYPSWRLKSQVSAFLQDVAIDTWSWDENACCICLQDSLAASAFVQFLSTNEVLNYKYVFTSWISQDWWCKWRWVIIFVLITCEFSPVCDQEPLLGL